jgi:hypothetical protein
MTHGGEVMTNGMDPGQMTPDERLDEVALLMATGMLRLWRTRPGAEPVAASPRAFSRDSGRNSLGCPAETRPPVTVE